MAKDELVELCRLLNEKGIRYMVAGAHACALHGYVRATEDYDLLVEPGEQNLKRVIEVVNILLPENSEALLPSELRESVVLKVVGEIEVDFMVRAWSVDFGQAQSDMQEREIDGVRIPYLGLTSLIASKSTAREIDRWDVKMLHGLQE